MVLCRPLDFTPLVLPRGIGINDEITQQEYREMKADYERQAAGLSDLLARLRVYLCHSVLLSFLPCSAPSTC